MKRLNNWPKGIQLIAAHSGFELRSLWTQSKSTYSLLGIVPSSSGVAMHAFMRSVHQSMHWCITCVYYMPPLLHLSSPIPWQVAGQLALMNNLYLCKSELVVIWSPFFSFAFSIRTHCRYNPTISLRFSFRVFRTLDSALNWQLKNPNLSSSFCQHSFESKSWCSCCDILIFWASDSGSGKKVHFVHFQ